MDRLFAVIGITYFITLTIFSFLPDSCFLIASAIFIFLEILSLAFKNIRKDKTLPAIFFTCLVASAGYLINYYKSIVPVQTLCGKNLTVTGQICELPYKKNNKFYYILNIGDIKEEPSVKNFKMSVCSYEPLDADIADIVTASVYTYEDVSPGFSQFKQYKFSKKIYLSGYILNHNFTPVISHDDSNHFSIYYYFLIIRRDVMFAFKRMFSEEYSSIINGIMFGDKYSISEETRYNFISSGIYHILAVSGLHVTIISQIILKILLKLKLNKRMSAALSCVGVLLFMFVSCFTPSVVRAGIMSIIYFTGLAIYRQSDSLNSLGLAMLMISIFNPNAGRSVGLWLSFLSTLGIITFYPKIVSHFQTKIKLNDKLSKYFLKPIFLTFSVILFTFPLSAFLFKNIYLGSFVSNILILPVVPLLILNSFFCMCLYILFPFQIWKLPGIINIYVIKYIYFICEFVTNALGLKIFLGYDFSELFILIASIILGGAFILKVSYKNLKIIFFSLSNFLVAACIFNKFIKKDDVIISLLSSPSDFSVVMRKGSRNSVIYCGDGSSKSGFILDYLCSIDSHKLDFLILPEFSPTQSSEVNDVMNRYGTDYAIFFGEYDSNKESKIFRKSNSKRYIFNKNFKFKLFETIPHEGCNFKRGANFLPNFAKILSEHFLALRDFCTVWQKMFPPMVPQKRKLPFVRCRIDTPELFLFKSKNKTWIYEEVYGKRILYCPDGGDILKLPEKFKKADILISKGIPNNFDSIAELKSIIFCSSRKVANDIKDKISHHNIESFSANNYKNIELILKKSGAYEIKERV